MNVPFYNLADSPIAPALSCFPISPNDAAELPLITKAIYIGVAGDVVLRSANGAEDVVFRNLPAGFTLDVRVRAVRATGTTASALVGLA